MLFPIPRDGDRKEVKMPRLDVGPCCWGDRLPET